MSYKSALFLTCTIYFLIIGCGNVETTEELPVNSGSGSTYQPKPVVLDQLSFQEFILDTNQHYRGLDIHQRTKTIVVAGSSGHVGFANYSGDSISWLANFNVDSLHLRDVEIWNGRVFVMSIASPAYIKEFRTDFVTIDTNQNWQTRLFNPHEKVFLDGMDLWGNGIGLSFGDPIGRHHVLKTTNEGVGWMQLPPFGYPDTIAFEAGFAASGTGVVCVGEGTAYIGYGGVQARVFKTTDYGDSWITIETPIAHGKAGKGIYCMAWKNELEGVIAGGNWEEPEADSCYAFTKDGGDT
ncbi:MAG: hypothetical protein JKY54_15225 [Flavobacteriales bacterium]|nr:hypothetical protein [Flavobacteriales bacterium]